MTKKSKIGQLSPEPQADKFDRLLRETAQLADKPETILAILFKTNAPLDAEQRVLLAESGVTVYAEAGQLYTARATREGLMYLAARKDVLDIEIAKSVKPTK